MSSDESDAVSESKPATPTIQPSQENDQEDISDGEDSDILATREYSMTDTFSDSDHDEEVVVVPEIEPHKLHPELAKLEPQTCQRYFTNGTVMFCGGHVVLLAELFNETLNKCIREKRNGKVEVQTYPSHAYTFATPEDKDDLQFTLDQAKQDILA
uniref:Uncharacterized protein n=1 Tax=Branchiostoma floridae TaxID=7739 RepID=C3Y843_BRAFL|eukprot:XP_002607502.1 hypothetical protein BRAFLDRAFT_69933 [Branchiostoma floridae]